MSFPAWFTNANPLYSGGKVFVVNVNLSNDKAAILGVYHDKGLAHTMARVWLNIAYTDNWERTPDTDFYRFKSEPANNGKHHYAPAHIVECDLNDTNYDALEYALRIHDKANKGV